MPRLARFAVLAVLPSALALAPVPKATGVLPGEFGVPANLTTQLPSCGQCHSPNPNANGHVTVSIATTGRVVAPGTTLEVAVRVDGGPGLGLAGFALETDAGSFTGGHNSRTQAGGGPAITHVDKFGNEWAFKFTAPQSPGPVRFTAAGQSVNANNNPSGDSFGFHGPDSNTPGVPYILFVNSRDVHAAGAPCPGTDGHPPLLGARAPARVGRSFRTEVHAIPPAAAVVIAIGTGASTWNGVPLPFDLAPLGAPGCLVHIDQVLTLATVSTGSGSGGGAAGIDWPVPNNPRLAGRSFWFQAFVQDAANRLGLTASNALRAVVQP